MRSYTFLITADFRPKPQTVPVQQGQMEIKVVMIELLLRLLKICSKKGTSVAYLRGQICSKNREVFTSIRVDKVQHITALAAFEI